MLDNNATVKWGICFVNFETPELIKVQLKTIMDLNRTQDFRVFIVDNSRICQCALLNDIAAELGCKDKVLIIDNSQNNLVGSFAHADGLEKALPFMKSQCEYLLFQDPDFFWLKKNFLELLWEPLSKGVKVIGAPYRFKVGFGNPDFPCAFGCALRSEDVGVGDFCCMEDTHPNYNESLTYTYPEFDKSHDVGWKIRKNYSNEKYLSFMQRPVFELSYFYGRFSTETAPVEYYFENSLIALHLFRGSQPLGIQNGGNTKSDNDKEVKSALHPWNEVKLKIAELTYDIARGRLQKLLYTLRKIYLRAKHSRSINELAQREWFFLQNQKFSKLDKYLFDEVLVFEKKRELISEKVEYLNGQLEYLRVNGGYHQETINKIFIKSVSINEAQASLNEIMKSLYSSSESFEVRHKNEIVELFTYIASDLDNADSRHSEAINRWFETAKKILISHDYISDGRCFLVSCHKMEKILDFCIQYHRAHIDLLQSNLPE